MAEYLTRIASMVPAATDTDEVVYIVPTGMAVVVSRIVVVNADGGDIRYSLAFVSDDSAPPALSDYIRYAKTLVADTSEEITAITLSAGYHIHYEASSTFVMLNIFGSIIDQIEP